MTLHISEFGGYPDGSDTTLAWHDALIALQTSSEYRLKLSKGTYAFDSKPDDINSETGVVIEGVSDWATTLQRTYTPAVIDEPFIRILGRGSKLARLEVQAKQGTTNGFGVQIFADNSTFPGGKCRLEDIRITGEEINNVHSATWRVALHVNGEGRTVNPILVRVPFLSNVHLFDATAWLATFRGVVDLEWHGGGAWQGGGTAKGINVASTSSKCRIDADIDWVSSAIAAGTMRGPGR